MRRLIASGTPCDAALDCVECTTMNPRMWLLGARPRTLPAAVVPVAVGTGLAAGMGGADLWRAAGALFVALMLQIGVNYANDYSDGVAGTDAERVGPTRLVASGIASARAVLAAALACFGLAALAGLVLIASIGAWWLLLVGAAALVAAWTYTGGPAPYGYYGLGEVGVFLFFGLVAVAGTVFVQMEDLPWLVWPVAVAVGLLACALLAVNNLRDRQTDAAVGKRTLAVRLGDVGARRLYAVFLLSPFGIIAALAFSRPWLALALLALPLAIPPLCRIFRDHSTSWGKWQIFCGKKRTLSQDAEVGPSLIAALGETGRVQLAFGVLLAIGLWLS